MAEVKIEDELFPGMKERLLRIVALTSERFGDREKALDWLQTPNPALQGTRPSELLDTDEGADKLLTMLGIWRG